MGTYHLGLDYGTSSSKMVLRQFDAPGGEIATIIDYKDGFRVPSRVCVAPDRLIFGSATCPHDAYALDSIKMQVAAQATRDAKFTPIQIAQWPAGLDAKAVATLTIWWMLGVAGRWLSKRDRKQPRMPWTLGIPVSFFADPTLLQVFYDLFWGATELRRTRGDAPDEIALSVARDRAQEAGAVGRPVGVDVDRYLRPEAVAALWWASQSPAVPDGPYVKIDIGAGTTNASFFRLHKQETRGPRKLSFFGAASGVVGMDQVDSELAAAEGNREPPIAYRERESMLLNDPALLRACGPAFEGICATVGQAWSDCDRRLRGAMNELAQQRQANIFFLGGGSRVAEKWEPLMKHPMDGDALNRSELLGPPDLRLQGRAPRGDLLPFVSVAYGLASPDSPPTDLPGSVPPVPRSGGRLAKPFIDDPYAK